MFSVGEQTFVFAQEYEELGVKVEIVADKLTIPWSIDWTPDGTTIFTERNGNLRMISPDGTLIEKPLLSLGVGGVEGGMLGVAVDPDFEKNNYIYMYYTYNEFLATSNKVVKYQVNLDDKTISEEKVLIEGIPGGPFHDGGRIKFGPDGKLYIATGDAGNTSLSQDLDSLAGKILRINSDGTIPEDNPFENSMVYSYGHRNPQGIDWDKNGNLFITEHGPSGLRGVAHDEINLIFPGLNYGWPDIIGDETKDGLQVPILHSGDDTWAPSGADFYHGDKIPQWTDKYFVATLRGSHLHMIDFDLEDEKKKVISHEKLFEYEFGRLRDVATGPDGFLYILTSNQDGRGTPDKNDDKILKLMPINTSLADNITEKSQESFNAGKETQFQYTGEGGSLETIIQHTEYDISPIQFDMDKKSLSFDFKKIEQHDFSDSNQILEEDIGVLIQRPLISPPYMIEIEANDNTTEYTLNDNEITITEDNFYKFALSLDEELEEGTIHIIGTYVIPEFGKVTIIILTVGIISIIVFSAKFSTTRSLR